LSPCGSITVHIYIQTVHRTTQITTNLEVFTNFTLAFYNNNNNNNNNIYLTAIGLSPGGSGFKHVYKYLTLCY